MPKPTKPKAATSSGSADAAIKVKRYRDKNDCDLIQEWLDKMSDNKTKAAILNRFTRLRRGNFGDCKPLREGVWELRIDIGPGYRVYYAKDGLTIVLLLCGGDKRSQNRDIDKACDYLNDWKQREREK